MVEKEQRSEEERRKIMERRDSIILDYKLLNFDTPNKRSEPNRRSGKEKRVK